MVDFSLSLWVLKQNRLQQMTMMILWILILDYLMTWMTVVKQVIWCCESLLSLGHIWLVRINFKQPVLRFTEKIKKEKHESESQIPYKSTFVSIDSPSKLESKKKKCIKGKL